MITPEDVLDKTLKQLLYEQPTEDDISAYNDTVNYVKCMLFSRFPQRRKYAQRLLDESWGTHLNVEVIEDKEIIYTYIRFDRTDKYILVEKYEKTRPFLEEMPTEEEIRKWPENDNEPHKTA